MTVKLFNRTNFKYLKYFLFVYLLEYKATILTCTQNFKGLQTGLTGFLSIESVNKNFKWNIGLLFTVLCDFSAFLPLCFKDLKGLETG